MCSSEDPVVAYNTVAMFNLERIVRSTIWALQPYRCARDDYSEGILLDANENAIGPNLDTYPITSVELENDKILYSDKHLERYPDPHQQELKSLASQFRNVRPEQIFFGVGSDESIDLAIRVFCNPGIDQILICPPTYGMYAVSAAINDVEIVKVPLLLDSFQLDVDNILSTATAHPQIKIIFLCSPGNPTGTVLNKKDMVRILDSKYRGIVLLDEAYIDFCIDTDESRSMIELVDKYPNLIVIQTLSKSFGLAGIRLGLSVSSPEIARLFNNTKAPYNISTPTSLIGRMALSPKGIKMMKANVRILIQERDKICQQFRSVKRAGRILGGNNSNFVLVEIKDAHGKVCNDAAIHVYKTLAECHGIVVRFRGMEPGCFGCLRISIGTTEQNEKLMSCINKILEE